ncbi:hypothetical protein F0L74_15550 [Chitinophaga agrisoli]|uniref:Uncharacterized protein n=1 Tax=Chitinophaga agrisoli TaxID=2607653 RepID=A0A5B2VRK8_9BACT|nr:hypothetical protein [Chitinophaga agrisoli]KAA2241318.1 hypothetical protein F0L74_15550 [Chitinophaga agrisoli]
MHSNYACAHERRKTRIGKTVPSNAGKLSNKPKATEVEEDDETAPFRRYLECGSYCIGFYFAQEIGSSYSHVETHLPSCEHFSYYSSDKFIVHRVIRI